MSLTKSASTRARAVASTRTWMRWLVRVGLLASSPAALLATPKVTRDLPRPLSVDVAQSLVEAPTAIPTSSSAFHLARDRAVLELLYSSALRVAELAGLDVEHLDFRRRTMLVTGKGSRERIVPFGKPAKKALERWCTQRESLLRRLGDGDGALFVSARGRRLAVRSLERAVKRWGIAIGRPDAHPHVLRHTCATHMIERGANLRILQEMLGHANLRTTQVYTHVSIAHLEREYHRAHPLSPRPRSFLTRRARRRRRWLRRGGFAIGLT